VEVGEDLFDEGLRGGAVLVFGQVGTGDLEAVEE